MPFSISSARLGMALLLCSLTCVALSGACSAPSLPDGDGGITGSGDGDGTGDTDSAGGAGDGTGTGDGGADGETGGGGDDGDGSGTGEVDSNPLEEGLFAAFRLNSAVVTALQDQARRAGQATPDDQVLIDGVVEGIDEDTAQLVFMDDAGGMVVTDVGDDGSFEVPLDPDRAYHIALTDDGRFEAPVVLDNLDDAPEPAGDEAVTDDPAPGEPGMELLLEVSGAVVEVMAGPLDGVGEPLILDDQSVPAGLSEDVELPGLTDTANAIEVETEAIDADRDGIPAIFDPDRDGDGMLDLVDDEVMAGIPTLDGPDTGGTASGGSVSGAFVFNNLKLDIDQLIPPPTILFTHNDTAVVTIGWVEDPADTPAGYAVQSVQAVDVPGWHKFGFVTTVNDWTVSPGMPGYVGYPTFGSNWSGSLYRETAGSSLWQVWVQSPAADATLAAAYPAYVESGKSVPLNWDLSGSGTPTSNKIDFYRLLITYTDGTSTVTRYAHASSLFSFRTPGVALSAATSTASYLIDPNNVSGDGHRTNPIVWPDATTMGDIVIDALPPKYDVSGGSGIIHGTMMWRFDVFYHDATGQQIGGLLTQEVPVTYTGGPSLTVTIPEGVLDRSGARTDMDGDGRADFDGAFNSSDIAGYKIDLTAVAITGGDNTGLFFYFLAESQAAGFAGF